MHYNFWDDDEPYPGVQTIALTRDVTTSVRDATSATAIVLPAYPNPFNPATHVAFELPAAGPALLEIVDLRGRRVAVLHDCPLTAGRHEVEWRGRDQQGVAVARGRLPGSSCHTQRQPDREAITCEVAGRRYAM
jgi:hypothetical protein